jgi:hypothetical protein
MHLWAGLFVIKAICSAILGFIAVEEASAAVLLILSVNCCWSMTPRGCDTSMLSGLNIGQHKGDTNQLMIARGQYRMAILWRDLSAGTIANLAASCSVGSNHSL